MSETSSNAFIEMTEVMTGTMHLMRTQTTQFTTEYGDGQFRAQ